VPEVPVYHGWRDTKIICYFLPGKPLFGGYQSTVISSLVFIFLKSHDINKDIVSEFQKEVFFRNKAVEFSNNEAFRD